MTDLRYKVIPCDHGEGVQISDELKQEWVFPDDCVELLNAQAEHIAELEKERDEANCHAYYILETCMVFSPKHFEAHNLEQRIDAVKELERKLNGNDWEDSELQMFLYCYISDLKLNLKEFKEGDV